VSGRWSISQPGINLSFPYKHVLRQYLFLMILVYDISCHHQGSRIIGIRILQTESFLEIASAMAEMTDRASTEGAFLTFAKLDREKTGYLTEAVHG
jgi:hypothetical protein